MNIDFLKNLRFFNPTSDLKILLLLEQIQNSNKITQDKLARYIHSAPSMINTYIKQLEREGFLVKNKKTKRNVEYTITKKGIDRKNYLLVTYMNELIELYNLTKINIELFIKNLIKRNYKNCVFYGAGETAKVIIKVIKDMPKLDFKLKFLVDDDINKRGEKFEGYDVVSNVNIKKHDIDAIIITSCVYEKEIRNKLRKLEYSDEKIISFFDLD
ncbi:MAG: MarR family transcriptional regulator [Actinomycetia bacterium]|nr:MarR family transcriptional regulator [Actinomycetes bacterium]